ncbi:HAD family hydrolase [Chloroflexota bacterium]
MKYEAVIFDLFGTLVDSYSYEEYENVLRQVTSVLTVPFDDFRRLWSETAQERSLGNIPSIEDNIEYICNRLKVRVDNIKIGLASKLRYDYISSIIRPRADAIEVLSCLKSQGYRIGLISNCSPETPIIWEDSPFAPLFDIALFSSSVGLKKHDPHIYQLASERLAVKPENCLYIGDGDSQELTGAASVGMYPIMIRVAYEDETQPHLANREKWDGPVISSLREVLALVKEQILKESYREASPLS